ncbi:MAG: hypothetical protein K9N48_03970 [Verrucomicrobia bacterium]|nr:hypothetical protein [Verrucomicrobiota bacterium]MCF7709014.1 hypothetical protein [Verrucomicrobiota bacterium]
MKTYSIHNRLNRSIQAFTVLEMVVTVALLIMIVGGLYAVFSQTQRALLSNETQVDVLESGRAAMSILCDELPKAEYSGVVSNLNTAHFSTELGYPEPLVVEIGNDTYSHRLEELFFLTRSNGYWIANGYFIAAGTNVLNKNWVKQSGVGTLYHWMMPKVSPGTTINSNDVATMRKFFKRSQRDPDFARVFTTPIVDGVVGFKTIPYDQNGRSITLAENGDYPNVIITNDPLAGAALPEFRQVHFVSNALPSSVDLELDVLAPPVLEKVKGIPNGDVQRSFLRDKAGQIKIFRQRIRIRRANQ